MRLEDVAKLANVSVSTVSRVVNGVDTVNASTRKRVLKVLEKSNYHPNLQARSLVVGRSSTIGIIVSNLLNPFFVDVFHAIEGDARANGFEVLVGNTNYDADQLSANIRMMIGRRVAGIALVISEALPPALSELVGVGIPIAIYDVGTQGKGIANIRFDNRKGMTQIVEYLCSMGHRRMAYIGLSSALLPTDVRRSAFLEIAARNSVETRDFKISFQEGLEGARAAVRDIVKSGFDPTAIICVNDMIAVGALRELRDHGIDVPGHVSVTGFDNIEFSEFTSPSLTTIQIPRDKVGHRMFDAILAGAKSRTNAGEEYMFSPELVVRESTGVARASNDSRRTRSRALLGVIRP